MRGLIEKGVPRHGSDEADLLTRGGRIPGTLRRSGGERSEVSPSAHVILTPNGSEIRRCERSPNLLSN